MRDRDAFGVALRTLRQRLRDGAYLSGAPLVIVDLALELGISATPVREALARLSGEGLVEDRRGWGYGVWRLERDACEELYRLHFVYMEYAISRGSRRKVKPVAFHLELAAIRTAGELRDATEALFDSIVEARCRDYAIAVHRKLQDRLAPMRLIEACHFNDGRAELQSLADTLRTGSQPRILQALKQYHRRRLDAVTELVQTLEAGPSLEINYISDID